MCFRGTGSAGNCSRFPATSVGWRFLRDAMPPHSHNAQGATPPPPRSSPPTKFLAVGVSRAPLVSGHFLGWRKLQPLLWLAETTFPWLAGTSLVGGSRTSKFRPAHAHAHARKHTHSGDRAHSILLMPWKHPWTTCCHPATGEGACHQIFSSPALRSALCEEAT
jgi:hypothetical protein